MEMANNYHVGIFQSFSLFGERLRFLEVKNLIFPHISLTFPVEKDKVHQTLLIR